MTERESALDDRQRVVLEAHLATCHPCRTLRGNLGAAAQAWKALGTHVVVPDPQREWYAIRRRLRAGERGEPRFRPAWLVAPVAVVAALALAFLAGIPRFSSPETPLEPMEMAHAEFVEVADESASTLVFVDEESGWLVVWTVNGADAGS